MTMWRAGMKACCINKHGWMGSVSGLTTAGPDKDDILTIATVKIKPYDGRTWFKRHFGKKAVCLEFSMFKDLWFSAAYFRPLIDQSDDTALIARIKNCKPARTPTPTAADPGEVAVGLVGSMRV